jgi:hypothetical protein
MALTDMCLDSGKKCKPLNNIARLGQWFLMTKTFPELPNRAHTFPLSSDIGHQVFLVGIYHSDSWTNHYADFLEAQGISVEKTPTPKRFQVPTRRIASLPPHFLTDPESNPGPHKKPRLTSTHDHPVRVLNGIFILGLILYVPGLFRSSPSFFRITKDDELYSQA